MAILTVGTGKRFATIAAATAAAHDGDTVDVEAGTYVNDFATIRTRIDLEAVDGAVTMLSTSTAALHPALLTITTDATVDGFTFSGLHTLAGTGAGVLVQGGAVTIERSRFTGNQTGLLATANAATSVTIVGSEFSGNGTGSLAGANIAVGAIKSLTVSSSFVHAAQGGDEVRSSAATTTITGTRIEDEGAAASVSVDLPSGGVASLQGDAIEKGAASTNAVIVRYGGETVQAGGALAISGNTVASDRPGAILLQNGSSTSATVASNVLYGVATAATGVASVSGTSVVTTRPGLGSAETPVATAAATATVEPAAASSAGGVAEAERGILVLDVSARAWQGDPTFTLTIDGVATGGTLAATASHAAGQTQTITIAGTFAAGAHAVVATFGSSLGAGPSGRALFLDGAQYNGQDLGIAAALTANGSVLIETAPITVATVVSFQLSEDAWHGDALAFISLDGVVQGGVRTVTASHAAGQTQLVDLQADLAPGPHTATVTILNGLQASAGANRALYVDAIDAAGVHYPAAAAHLAAGGSSSFAFTVAPPTASNGSLFVTVGSPQPLLALS